jgi:hypothetical protein
VNLHAHVGDQVVVRCRTVGGADRTGQIVEVRGADGGPPYVVVWSDDRHEGLFFPGPDATIEPRATKK